MQPDRLQPILDVAVARFEQDRALARRASPRTRDRLAERKVIERAKGLVMKQKGVDEDDAYRVMRKLAMDRNRSSRRRAADHRRDGSARVINVRIRNLHAARSGIALRRRGELMRCTSRWCEWHRHVRAWCAEIQSECRPRRAPDENLDESILYRLALLMAWISLKREAKLKPIFGVPTSRSRRQWWRRDPTTALRASRSLPRTANGTNAVFFGYADDDEELRCAKFGDYATFRSTRVPFLFSRNRSRHRGDACSARRQQGR